MRGTGEYVLHLPLMNSNPEFEQIPFDLVPKLWQEEMYLQETVLVTVKHGKTCTLSLEDLTRYTLFQKLVISQLYLEDSSFDRGQPWNFVLTYCFK